MPALQSSRRARRATSAAAGLSDHRRPEARPASLTLAVLDQRAARGVAALTVGSGSASHRVMLNVQASHNALAFFRSISRLFWNDRLVPLTQQ
jgi:hypothetical protein